MNKKRVERVFILISAVIIAVCGGGTFLLNRTFMTRERLSSHILSGNVSQSRMFERALCTYAEEVLKKEGPDAAFKILNSYEGVRKGDRFYLMSGVICYRKGQYSTAKEYFIQIKENLRFIASALLYRGFIEAAQGKPDKALEYYLQAHEIKKDDLRTLFVLAQFYYSKQEYLDAMKYLSLHISLTPGNWKLDLMYAKSAYQEGIKSIKNGNEVIGKNIMKAGAALLKEHVNSNSLTPEMRLFLVDMLIKLEGVYLAADELNKMFEKLDQFPEKIQREIVKKYAFFSFRFLQYRKADRLFNLLNDMTEGENPDVIFWLATVKYTRRLMKESEELLKKALEIYKEKDITDGELLVLNNLAHIDIFAGDYVAAFKRYNRIIAINSSFWQAYAGLTEVLIYQEEFQEAGKMLLFLKKQIPSEDYHSYIRLKGMLKKEEQFTHELKCYRDNKSDS